MNIEWVGPIPQSNFKVGRNGRSIYAVVIHVSTGSMQSLDNWFLNPVARVSANYGVSKAGEVHGYVKEADTSYHAGVVDRPTWPYLIAHPKLNPNLITIGIEHEGLATDVWPDEQYAASAALIADICARNSIPIDRDHIVRHSEIRASKTCPGLGDVDRLVAIAKGVNNGVSNS